jgi:hypothetical protein
MNESSTHGGPGKTQQSSRRAQEPRQTRSRPSVVVSGAGSRASRPLLRGTEEAEKVDHAPLESSRISLASKQPNNQAATLSQATKSNSMTRGSGSTPGQRPAPVHQSAAPSTVAAAASSTRELYALRAEVAKLRLRCEELENELALLRKQVSTVALPPVASSASTNTSNAKELAQASQAPAPEASQVAATGTAGTPASQTTARLASTSGLHNDITWHSESQVLDWADEMETMELERRGRNSSTEKSVVNVPRPTPGTWTRKPASASGAGPERPPQPPLPSTRDTGQQQRQLSEAQSLEHPQRIRQREPRPHGTEQNREARQQQRRQRRERPFQERTLTADAKTQPHASSAASKSAEAPPPVQRPHRETVERPPASAWLFAVHARAQPDKLRFLVSSRAAGPESAPDRFISLSFSVSRWINDQAFHKTLMRMLLQLWRRLAPPALDSGTTQQQQQQIPPPLAELLRQPETEEQRPLDRQQVWALCEPVLLEACRHPTLLVLLDCHGLNDKTKQAVRFNVAYFVEAAAAARERFEATFAIPPRLVLVLESYPVQRRPVLGGHPVYPVQC